MITPFAGLYVLLDEDTYGERLIPVAQLLVDTGVRLLQYRAKQGIDRGRLEALMSITKQAGAVLIVNDDLVAARLADGLHLGQEDLTSRTMKELRIALPGKYLGISCHTREQALWATEADYIGVGPYTTTQSKKLAREPLGIAGIKAIITSVKIPVCAIGGITVADVQSLRAIGVAMVAVIGAVAHAADSASAARSFMEAFSIS